jgi:hypothetical protein
MNDDDGIGSRAEWDKQRFGELLATSRSMSTSLASGALGLIIGLVTILGFAVDRESWGLAATALIFEAMMFVVIRRFRRAATLVLDAAATLETDNCGDSTVTDAHRGFMAPDGRSSKLQLGVIYVAVVHIAVTILLATTQGWTFAGT